MLNNVLQTTLLLIVLGAAFVFRRGATRSRAAADEQTHVQPEPDGTHYSPRRTP
jgi:hypothetical protein